MLLARWLWGFAVCWICFSSVTCGTECLQGPSRWPWRSFLHSFQKFESSFFDSYCSIGALPYVGISHPCIYWASWIICILPRLSVELRSWNVDTEESKKGCVWLLEQLRLSPDGVGYSRVNPCTSDASHTWTQPFVSVTRAGFFWARRARVIGDKLGLDLSHESMQQVAEEKVTPAALSSEAVVLCLPHPVWWQGRLIVKSKEAAASACVFLWLYLVPEPSLYYLLKSPCLTIALAQFYCYKVLLSWVAKEKHALASLIWSQSPNPQPSALIFPFHITLFL